MAKEKKVLAPVIAIVNMKGGVGKTTISAHLFREFYRKKSKNILLIDFDPQFNLTQTLKTQQEYEALKVKGATILSVMECTQEASIFKTFESDGQAPEVADLVVPLKRARDRIAKHGAERKTYRLDLIPGDFDLCKFSLIDDKKVLDVSKRRFIDFISKAREQYDIICIDCNPSTSFLNMCSLKVATHLLVPVRPDRYSMLGLRLLDSFVNNFKEIVEKPKKIIILNGVPTTSYDPTVENELRSDPIYGPITLATNLTISTLLTADPNYTGFATDKKVAYTKALRDKMHILSDELAMALGVK
ncbi:ParA family protein [Pseudomonas caspiana]|uniref:AAA domain-containing protein n=1 Tax=Pseudomonas caspiana TaxID=1451454 RepID=A0A1Y3P3R1_9PSED|nr:ParA family protein [Pseudomonas caspiana]OUM74466.1 hypothetical protein AUC60_06870 [Pseudomonas caspiana]